MHVPYTLDRLAEAMAKPSPNPASQAEARRLKEALEAAQANPGAHIHRTQEESRAAAFASAPRSQGEALRKIGALLAFDLTDAERDTLRADCAKWTDPDGDRVALLAERWLRIAAYLDGPSRSAVAGFTDPAHMDAVAAADALWDELSRMTPTTPKGVAAMLDVITRSCGNASLPGSEDWNDDSDPEARMMRHARHGAYVAAGIECDG